MFIKYKALTIFVKAIVNSEITISNCLVNPILRQPINIRAHFQKKTVNFEKQNKILPFFHNFRFKTSGIKVFLVHSRPVR